MVLMTATNSRYNTERIRYVDEITLPYQMKLTGSSRIWAADRDSVSAWCTANEISMIEVCIDRLSENSGGYMSGVVGVPTPEAAMALQIRWS
jgi:hypothetical protein